MWLYKNSPGKKREKHCLQVPMDDDDRTAVLEPEEKKKKNCFKKKLWRNFETWRICFQKMKENIKRFCDFRDLFRHLLN
jgi:hypothetical protein